VAVIGGCDDQRVVAVRRIQRHANRVRELDGIGERAVGIPGVVAVIDAPAFDHQEEAFGTPPENRDRDRGHLRERRLPRGVRAAIGLEVHVGRIEEAEQVVDLLGIRLEELLAVPDECCVLPTRDPLRRQVASVEAQSCALRKRRVRELPRAEVLATPAQDDLEAIAEGELDELPGDVREARGPRLGREVVVALPIPLGAVGVEGAGRGVGDCRRRDQTGGEPPLFCSFDDRPQLVSRHAREVPPLDLPIHREHPAARLGPRDDGGHRARGVRRLLIGVVRLEQRRVGEVFEGESVLLPRLPAELAFEDARRRDGADPHAVAEEDDDVPRPTRYGGPLPRP
jgi:hypothetical protein